jgi:cytochrome d ubiquinol oxidase subunit II
LQAIPVIAIVAAAWAVRDRHDGWAFGATAIAIALTVGSIFIDLYPNGMVSSTSEDNNLTISNAASGNYALKLMTIVAVVLFPIVLAYQLWNFHVFRQRIASPPAPSSPTLAGQETP